MKSILLTLFVIISSPLAHAYKGHRLNHLSAPVDLATSNVAESFWVNYPGLGELAICKLKVTAGEDVSTSITTILESLEIDEDAHHRAKITVVDTKSALIDLPLMRYLTWIGVSTKDGSTLEDALSMIEVHAGDLMITAERCRPGEVDDFGSDF